MKRRRYDWWCFKCSRPLNREGKDSVSLIAGKFMHDGCGGDVSAGDRRPVDWAFAATGVQGEVTAIDVVLSRHAVERFRERVRPGLNLPAAREALERLVAMSPVVAERPAWLHEDGEASDAWLEVTDAIVLALRRCGASWHATTCLTRGGLDEGARQHRNRVGKARRSRRRLRREKASERRVARALDKGVRPRHGETVA